MGIRNVVEPVYQLYRRGALNLGVGYSLLLVGDTADSWDSRIGLGNILLGTGMLSWPVIKKFSRRIALYVEPPEEGVSWETFPPYNFKRG